MSGTSASELAGLARISDALFEQDDLDSLILRALETAIEEAGAESGSILLADPENEQLVFRYSIGASPVPSGTAIPWKEGIAGNVFVTGKAERRVDVKTDPRHLSTIDEKMGHTTRDVLCVPLKRWGGAPVGVINVLNKKDGVFTDADLARLTVIGSLAAVAIAQAERFRDAKLAEIARTLGNIGHDLKNLLTPVLSSAGLLSEELSELFERPELGNRPELEASRELCMDAIDLIHRTSDRIHHRVKELADCVKGRSTAPKIGPCDLSQVVKDVFSTLSTVASDAGVWLVAEGLDELDPIQADERRIYTALYNLVLNAVVEVDRDGSVTVAGKVAPSGRDVDLEVRDTGRGMEPEVAESLFTEATVSTKSGGTGLGTRIVKDVIDAHRGSISVESRVGDGTRFVLRLPFDPLDR